MLPKPPAPRRVLDLVHLLDLRVLDLLEDELRHAVAALDGEVLGRVVEQDHAHVAAVVGVDHAGARVDELLEREAGARRHARVAAVGHGDDQVCLDEALATRRDHGVVGGRQVQARGQTRAARRQDGLGRELLHAEHGGGAAALGRHGGEGGCGSEGKMRSAEQRQHRCWK